MAAEKLERSGNARPNPLGSLVRSGRSAVLLPEEGWTRFADRVGERVTRWWERVNLTLLLPEEESLISNLRSGLAPRGQC